MKKEKRIQIVISFLILLLSLTACRKSASAQLREQLDLGQRYLTELNYDEAILAFEKAIALDPSELGAYLGLSEAYSGKGDLMRALVTLEKGEDEAEEEIPENYENAIMKIGVQLMEQSFSNHEYDRGFHLRIRTFRPYGWEQEAVEVLVQDCLNYITGRLERAEGAPSDQDKKEILQLLDELERFIENHAPVLDADVMKTLKENIDNWKISNEMMSADSQENEESTTEEQGESPQEQEESIREQSRERIDTIRKNHADFGAENLAIQNVIEEKEGRLARGAYPINQKDYILEEDRAEGREEYVWYAVDEKGGGYEYHYYSVDLDSKTIKEIYRTSGEEFGPSESETVDGTEISYADRIDETTLENQSAAMESMIRDVFREARNEDSECGEIGLYVRGKYTGSMELEDRAGPAAPGYGELAWTVACEGPDGRYYEFLFVDNRQTGELRGQCTRAEGNWFSPGEKIESSANMNPELLIMRDLVIRGFRKAAEEATGRDLSEEAEVKAVFLGNVWEIHCVMKTGAEFIYRGRVVDGVFGASWDGSYYHGDQVNRELFEGLRELETEIEISEEHDARADFTSERAKLIEWGMIGEKDERLDSSWTGDIQRAALDFEFPQSMPMYQAILMSDADRKTELAETAEHLRSYLDWVHRNEALLSDAVKDAVSSAQVDTAGFFRYAKYSSGHVFNRKISMVDGTYEVLNVLLAYRLLGDIYLMSGEMDQCLKIREEAEKVSGFHGLTGGDYQPSFYDRSVKSNFGEFRIDPYGRVVWREDRDGNIEEYQYSDQPGARTMQAVKRDAADNRILEQFEYELDDQGRCKTYRCQSENGFGWTFQFSGENGHVSATETYTQDGKETSKRTSEIEELTVGAEFE